jgi:hypothetical protein
MSLISPLEFFERTLFPQKEEHEMYYENTFRFFQRVLTEMEEAKNSAAQYQALAQQHGLDEDFNEKTWDLLTTATVQIEQMKKDIKIFVDVSTRTCDGIYHCRGDRTIQQSRQLFFEHLMMHMFEPFTKVHGKDHNNPSHSKFVKLNVVDKVDSMSTTVSDQFHLVTGHFPGQEPGNQRFDNLQVFFNQLENAGSNIFQSLHLTKLGLGLANPYVVNFL